VRSRIIGGGCLGFGERDISKNSTRARPGSNAESSFCAESRVMRWVHLGSVPTNILIGLLHQDRIGVCLPAILAGNWISAKHEGVSYEFDRRNGSLSYTSSTARER
jgi:hypothetical protein